MDMSISHFTNWFWNLRGRKHKRDEVEDQHCLNTNIVNNCPSASLSSNPTNSHPVLTSGANVNETAESSTYTSSSTRGTVLNQVPCLSPSSDNSRDLYSGSQYSLMANALRHSFSLSRQLSSFSSEDSTSSSSSDLSVSGTSSGAGLSIRPATIVSDSSSEGSNSDSTFSTMSSRATRSATSSPNVRVADLGTHQTGTVGQSNGRVASLRTRRPGPRRRGAAAPASASTRGRRSIVPQAVAAIAVVPNPEPGPSTSRGPNQTNDSGHTAGNMRPNMNQSLNGGGYFECIICLDNLDSPATVNVNEVNDNEGVDIMHGGSRRGVGGRRGRGARSGTQGWDPREISTSACGHMYHRYCLEKWFQEQGKKTCPSCRKKMPGKLIRLFPNIGQNSGSSNQSIQFAHQPSNPTNQPANAAATTNPQVSAVVLNQSEIPVASAAAGIQLQQGQVEGNMARARAIRVVTVSDGQCSRQECQDTAMLHGLLQGDYDGLQVRYDNLAEDLDVRNAQMLSLQESYDKINEELTELRAAPSSATKRRREN